MGNKLLESKKRKGESDAEAIARLGFTPETRGACTSEFYSVQIGGKEGANSTANANEFERRTALVRNGDMSDLENTLVSQSITLDLIFNEMAVRASVNLESYPQTAERYLRMALKAQSQCRTTIDSLAEIKNPRSITITKQANIAGQQVVNNGVMNTANNDLPRTGKNKKPSNELLEEIEHERVDSGTTTAASKEYQKVEAVEKVNRGKDSRGKG